MNENKQAVLGENATEESFDFDAFERQLENSLEESLEGLEYLENEKVNIGSPDKLGNTIMEVVWDQCIIQIGSVAGEDFVKENMGRRLDLRNDAHIQTADNFEQQNYATHNTYVDYEKRGEEYRKNFFTDPNEQPKAKQRQEQRYNEKTKAWETYDNVDQEWKKTLREDYREPYEIDRRQDKTKLGNKTIHKDHQVADATIARDPEAGAYMSLEEKVKAANSKDNLNDLDSAANISKSDHDGEKWIRHERTGMHGEGETNAEYFGIDEEEYIKKDQESKEAYQKKKQEKKEEEIALGKKSQREDAFRIGGKALRAAIMACSCELLRKMRTS